MANSRPEQARRRIRANYKIHRGTVALSDSASAARACRKTSSPFALQHPPGCHLEDCAAATSVTDGSSAETVSTSSTPARSRSPATSTRETKIPTPWDGWNTVAATQPNGLVESGMRWKLRVRFGERPGETDQHERLTPRPDPTQPSDARSDVDPRSSSSRSSSAGRRTATWRRSGLSPTRCQRRCDWPNPLNP